MTKRHRNKNGWKIEQLWKIGKNKNQILALFLTKTPPDDWPDALDCLTLGLVANKLGKISENLILGKCRIIYHLLYLDGKHIVWMNVLKPKKLSSNGNI